MLLREEIDHRYRNTAREQGMQISLEYCPELPKSQEIVEDGEKFIIKLNSDKIGGGGLRGIPLLQCEKYLPALASSGDGKDTPPPLCTKRCRGMFFVSV